MVILLLLLIQEGLLSVSSVSMCTEYWLASQSIKLAQEKSVVRLTDCLNMTIAVDLDVNHKPNTKNDHNGSIHTLNWTVLDLYGLPS